MMPAIATLVNNDPYLSLSKSERIAARRERRSKLRGRQVRHEPESAPIEAEPPPPVQSWEERQKTIPLPKPKWADMLALIEVVPEPAYPHVETIHRVVCKYFDVRRNDLLSPRRCQRIAYPRQVAYYLAKTLTAKSLPEIGRRFGGRDHTTVLHGYRKIEAIIKTDWTVAYDVAHLEAML